MFSIKGIVRKANQQIVRKINWVNIKANCNYKRAVELVLKLVHFDIFLVLYC